MGCSGCSTGRGSGTPGGCNNNGSCGTGGCNKLNVFDWLSNMQLPSGQEPFPYVEIRFKNSRKEFYKNEAKLQLNVGEIVAVEASPGHDIGSVSITGELVRLQMRKKKFDPAKDEVKKIYRKANNNDIDKWKAAMAQEKDTMYKARVIATALGLKMKLSDVEFQGDKTKAIFYYTADDRVDFRELIKRLAEEFRIRVEMRQIGARQEASRLGGIGSCGRELCCSTWLTDFRTVSTSAAKYQQLSLNPQKLAGQCGKLKCCLNYELDSYMDAIKDFPDTKLRLETNRGYAVHQKTDIFRRVIWYSLPDERDTFIPLSIEKVKEFQELNKQGIKADIMPAKQAVLPEEKKPDYENVVGQDSLTRFDRDKTKRSNNNNRRNKKKKSNAPQANTPQQGEAKAPSQQKPPQQRPPQQRRNNRPPRPKPQQGEQNKPQ